jgi:hypothetical protein
MSDCFKPAGNFLVCLPKKFHKVAYNVLVSTIEKCGTDTSVTSAARTSNTMNVVIDIRRKIIVNDMGHVGDIETASGNCGSDHDGSTASSEGVKCRFTLTLGTIAMNRGSGKVVGH